MSLYRDQRGFIWMGTREGLNRYNSNGIKTFKLNKSDSTSLFCNNILRVTGDQKGNLYLLTEEGVARFDVRRDRFVTLHQGNVSAILYHNDSLYIAKSNKIYQCDTSTGELTLQAPFTKEINDEIIALEYDHEGTLWIGTVHRGLYGIERDGKMSHPFDEAQVTQIYEDSAHRLWVGTWEAGCYIRKKDDTWVNLKKEDGLRSNFVRCFVEDNRGVIWVGTFLGLHSINPHNHQVHTYIGDGSKEGLTHSSVWSLMKDHQGTIWVGTYFGGVNYFNPEYEIYTRYKKAEKEQEGLSSSIVGKMIEDSESRLWIGTEGGGVNVLNPKTGKFKWYRHAPYRNSLSGNNVKTIAYDSLRHAMWIGTHLGGLNRLNLSTNYFTHYRHNSDNAHSIPSDIVRDVIFHNREVIVATKEGIASLNPETGKFTPMFQDNKHDYQIREAASILIDKKGILWIAAIGEGLFAYDFKTDKLKRYQHKKGDATSLSSNNINHILEDKDGNLWFATSGTGLDRYIAQEERFENFDALHNGLSSDCVFDIRQWNKDKLLLITNEGFSIFDISTQRFTNYTRENGFPMTSTNENSICFTRSGRLYLGGTHGMVSFLPEDLEHEPKPYQIIPNRLIVDGLPVAVGDQTGILSKSLCYSKGISIKARYSVFTLDFANSNFLKSNQEELIYRLDGFSNEWTPTRGQHEFTYTNLNPGDYTFILRSRNATGPEARLKIEILPPFYRTTLAWFIYILLTITALWAIFRTYKARIKLRESLRYEQQHLKDMEELNQSKLRFFTNISHEFRTPLTLIMGQVEMLLQVQSFTPTIYNKILRIYKNCNQLKELISELLDFRKQELGHMKIRVSKNDMGDFLYENFLIFKEYAQYRNLNLEFIPPKERIECWFDPKQMQKVINNLLSNAMKHTSKEGRIVMWVTKREKTVELGVRNTGKGISHEELLHIFDRYYQASNSQETTQTGTGIGLALTKGIVELHHGQLIASSEEGVSTTFIASLPSSKSTFKPEEIAIEEPSDNFKTPSSNNEVEHSFLMERNEMDEHVYQRIHGTKMLIVEDNDSLRELLRQLFEPFYEVTTAKDGDEGWNDVVAQMPQIVVSDVMMPRLSGTELCRRIKEDINTCHIPVVLLTARTALEHRLESLRTGADDYITKPFNTTLLLSRCNNLVNSRIVLKEKFSQQPQQSARMLATNSKDQELIERATTLIEDNMDNPEFNITLFSREMGMARTNLFSKIKAITGKTPNEFIQTIRLKKAAYMLIHNTEWNISDIADRTGFSSGHYFSKCFKAQFSLSPLAYRKEMMGRKEPDPHTTPTTEEAKREDA